MSSNTTILISKNTKEKIKELGRKGETYDDILNKMYKRLKLKESMDLLMNTEGYMTLDEAEEWTEKHNKLEKL
jgi:predicted CopG family antitoxin